jgi:hypothetical protein
MGPIPIVGTAALSLVLVAATATALPGPSSALTVIHAPTGDPVLTRVDLETGDLTAIGPLGMPDRVLDGLAFLPSGQLTAVDRVAGVLVLIDPTTGQGTLIGSLGVTFDLFTRLDLAASACGDLYLLTSPNETESELWRIDPATGAAESLGAMEERLLGLAALGEDLYGLVVPASFEDLRIVRLDPATQSVTEIATVDGLAAFEPSTLDFYSESELISMGFAFGPPLPGPPALIVHRFDLDGDLGPPLPLLFGTGGIAPLGLAAGPPPGRCPSGSPLPIPAASPFGLVVLALILAAGGAVISARRPSA